MQTVLRAHRSAADASRVHDHYLKGTVFCGQCGSRLLVCNAKNAHHDEYAVARNNLDDSLHLLEHAADIYARCEDANRRLCNQAFFTKSYIEEEGEVRADYARPFDALANREVQQDALTWVENARNENEVRTPTEGGSSVEGSHLAHLG